MARLFFAKRANARPKKSESLTACKPDDGPLTDAQYRAIKKLVPQGRIKVIKSLF